MDYWMYWFTAIVFTGVGYFFARNEGPSFSQSKRITQETIDTLIEMGYVKTRGFGDEIEMIKWDEEEL